MALTSPDVQNIVIGAPTQVALGPYVTAKGSATYYDIGHTLGGAEITLKTERHEVIVDRFLGPVSSEPTKRNEQVKFKMLEGMMKNLALAAGNDPATAVSGADPNFVFKRNMSERAYYSACKVVGRGLGTTKVRTYIAYRSVAGEFESIPLKKDTEQAYGITMEVMEETTGSGTDSSNWTDA
jgi:hypothetical protein